MKQNKVLNEFMSMEKLRHENRKEIISIQDEMQNKAFARKIKFAKYLYDLKNSFLDKEQSYKVAKLQMIKRK